MSGSKDRPRWHELPMRARDQIEYLVGDRVVDAQNCPGGYSPGFASRLILAGGRTAFAKAVDAMMWPEQAPMYRDEAHIAIGLTAAGLADVLPTPRFLGSCDDGSYVVLAFECVEGSEPVSPWRLDRLAEVAAAVGRMSGLLTPSPIAVPGVHPRLGGWASISTEHLESPCAGAAAPHVDDLVALECRGLVAAHGTALVHFDALPHNILHSPAGVMLVDWPHARLGAPIIDLLTVLASGAADGIDPEPILAAQPVSATAEAADIDAILAALSGFSLAGAVDKTCPAQIAAAKMKFGRGALGWLLRRLGITSTAS
jgi:Phosphotransferase enzyme family